MEQTMSEPIYIETWEVSSPNGNRLQIAFTESQCPTYEILEELRSNMAEEHHCKLEYLIRTDTIEEGADDE